MDYDCRFYNGFIDFGQEKDQEASLLVMRQNYVHEANVYYFSTIQISHLLLAESGSILVRLQRQNYLCLHPDVSNQRYLCLNDNTHRNRLNCNRLSPLGDYHNTPSPPFQIPPKPHSDCHQKILASLTVTLSTTKNSLYLRADILTQHQISRDYSVSSTNDSNNIQNIAYPCPIEPTHSRPHAHHIPMCTFPVLTVTTSLLPKQSSQTTSPFSFSLPQHSHIPTSLTDCNFLRSPSIDDNPIPPFPIFQSLNPSLTPSRVSNPRNPTTRNHRTLSLSLSLPKYKHKSGRPGVVFQLQCRFPFTFLLAVKYDNCCGLLRS